MMFLKFFKQCAAIAVFSIGLLAIHTMQAQAQTGQDQARAVISSQLEAFLSGDFDQAYSYASPTIKRIFPTQDQFMSMVQSGYLPVLRPGNYTYGQAEQLNGERIRQDVLIQAPGGEDWTATYFMALQPDGTWKVDAVTLKKGAAGII